MGVVRDPSGLVWALPVDAARRPTQCVRPGEAVYMGQFYTSSVIAGSTGLAVFAESPASLRCHVVYRCITSEGETRLVYDCVPVTIPSASEGAMRSHVPECRHASIFALGGILERRGVGTPRQEDVGPQELLVFCENAGDAPTRVARELCMFGRSPAVEHLGIRCLHNLAVSRYTSAGSQLSFSGPASVRIVARMRSFPLGFGASSLMTHPERFLQSCPELLVVTVEHRGQMWETEYYRTGFWCSMVAYQLTVRSTDTRYPRSSEPEAYTLVIRDSAFDGRALQWFVEAENRSDIAELSCDI